MFITDTQRNLSTLKGYDVTSINGYLSLVWMFEPNSNFDIDDVSNTRVYPNQR